MTRPYALTTALTMTRHRPVALELSRLHSHPHLVLSRLHRLRAWTET